MATRKQPIIMTRRRRRRRRRRKMMIMRMRPIHERNR
jgi:hypothetical protein